MVCRNLKAKVEPCIQAVLQALDEKYFFDYLIKNNFIKDEEARLILTEEEKSGGRVKTKEREGKFIHKGSISEKMAIPTKLFQSCSKTADVGERYFKHQVSDHDVLFSLPNIPALFNPSNGEEKFWLKLQQLEGEGMQEFVEVIPMMDQRKISPPLDSGAAVMFLKESVGEIFVDPAYMEEHKAEFLAADCLVAPRRKITIGGVRKTEVLDLQVISHLAALRSKMGDKVEVKIVGPAVNVRIEEKQNSPGLATTAAAAVIDIDFILGFPTEFPPKWKDEFLNRERSGWLSRTEVEYLVNRGVFITTKYARGECNHTWRYCFGNQYNYLALAIPERYKNLLRGLRYVYKAHLHPLGSGLTSHHMKTLFLWYMDECHHEDWRSVSEDQIFYSLLLYVCDHLETSSIPHYIMP